MGVWIVLLIGALVLGHGNLPASAVIFALLGAVAYWFSLHLHPFSQCRKCGGTGRHKAAMFPWSNRSCIACGGRARHRRWGVQFLHNTPSDKQTWAERAAAKAAGRRGAPRLYVASVRWPGVPRPLPQANRARRPTRYSMDPTSIRVGPDVGPGKGRRRSGRAGGALTRAVPG